MDEMRFAEILEEFHSTNKSSQVFCAAIHAGKERKSEYGVSSQADYRGRGDKADLYTFFVLEELVPFIKIEYPFNFTGKAFAGFSLGGLMALDIVLNHPGIFSKAAIFSGSFWWRSMDQKDKRYDDNEHRIIQQIIRNGNYKPGLKFFFQCGNMDEKNDRNKMALSIQ
jgi:predicted alpha/beta superfamily hydrolase